MPLRCPRCGSEAQDGARFCVDCGDRLALLCEACGALARADQRFCGSCGAQLGSALQPVRERRLVSVMFCDMVGFTTFSESRDHEDVRDVLAEYFASARRIVADYGGTIEKFIGDAVMAVWGAPLAHEDDAERSVRVGLELVEAVAMLAERLEIPELCVRVGVLTGEAAVELGATNEGMVTGDAVNTAARIQSIADPGSVLVDDTTRLACESAVEFAPAGEHLLKGKRAPLRVWRAVRLLDELEGGFRSGAVQPPFVGRAPQLATISHAVRSLRDPQPGVRIVSVVADAGLGKSRLSWESELHADGGEAPARWYRGRSLGFGEGAGLSGLADVVRMALGIRRSDAPELQRRVAEQVVAELFTDDPDDRLRVSSAVSRLLDLDDRRTMIQQGELFSAWRALLERLAAEGPLVLVFEELQLADQALVDFVLHLRDWTEATRIMILLLSRPDRRLRALADGAEEIPLVPLTDQEMNDLVMGAVANAPEPLVAAIRAEGGGIPLYAVETLRALADRDVLIVKDSRYVARGTVAEVSVPPTISALVSSRLDGLGRLERQLLAVGAVLGESFTVEAVAAVSDVDGEDARGLLDGLVATAMLGYQSDRRSPLRGRYAFLQGVVRRVVLSRLSRRERKRAHLAAAAFLERQETPEPDAEAVLAGHLLAAEQAHPNADDAPAIRDRARAALRAAAERAAAVGALAEALSLFDRAAELAAEQPERAAILEQAGAVAFRAGDAEASSARYRAAQEIHGAAGRERERLRLRALELQASYHLGTNAALVSQLRTLDAELGDERDAVKALAGNVLAFSLYQLGAYEEALEVASRSAVIAEECADQGELGAALLAQASALQELEKPHAAIALQHRVVPIAQQQGPRRIAPVLANLALSLASIGRYDEAADRARDAIAATQRGGERLRERWARLVLGRALCSLGEWDRAVAEIEPVMDDVPPYYIGMAVGPLVVIALGRAQHDRVRRLVAEHESRLDGDDDIAADVDFRVLRAAALVIGRDGDATELSRLIEQAETGDYAEWSGWLAPIVDRIVAAPRAEPLAATLAVLNGPGAIKETAPVLAQARRLEAHLAVRGEDHAGAGSRFAQAERLAGSCGLAFDTAVVRLEQAEHTAARAEVVDRAALASARTTFMRLHATPWLARSDAIPS